MNDDKISMYNEGLKKAEKIYNYEGGHAFMYYIFYC